MVPRQGVGQRTLAPQGQSLTLWRGKRLDTDVVMVVMVAQQREGTSCH